jgi:hypothetical protein
VPSAAYVKREADANDIKFNLHEDFADDEKGVISLDEADNTRKEEAHPTYREVLQTSPIIMTPLKESTHIQKELHLSFLDQQPHIRVYGRYYLILPFPSSSSPTLATHALQTGFQEVLHRFPYLAGTGSISPDNKNQLQVLYLHPIDAGSEAKRIFTSGVVDDA